MQLRGSLSSGFNWLLEIRELENSNSFAKYPKNSKNFEDDDFSVSQLARAIVAGP